VAKSAIREETHVRLDCVEATLRALLDRLQTEPTVLKPAEAAKIAQLLEWPT
jgi:hypothetical protein